MNNVILLGNLTKNPSLIITSEGTSICRFRMAVNRQRKEEQETLYINITCFGNLAMTCNKFLKKGARVIVEGRLKSDEYVNKENQKVTEIIIIANDVHFVSLVTEEENNDAKQ